MGYGAWKRLVLETEQTILHTPQEYIVAIGNEDVAVQIRNVFAEFLREARTFNAPEKFG